MVVEKLEFLYIFPLIDFMLEKMKENPRVGRLGVWSGVERKRFVLVDERDSLSLLRVAVSEIGPEGGVPHSSQAAGDARGNICEDEQAPRAL